MPSQAAFRKRLQTAVDAIFAGNVSAAAEGLDVSQPTLHKILSGKTRESKGSTISHLAARLGVPEAWLRGEKDPSIDGLKQDDIAIGLGQILVSRYFSRQWEDYVGRLGRLGNPTTEAGDRIFSAFEGWRSQDRKPRGDLLRACMFGALEAQIAEGKRPRPPVEHLEAVRAVSAADVELLRFTVSTLRRLAEATKTRPESGK